MYSYMFRTLARGFTKKLYRKGLRFSSPLLLFCAESDSFESPLLTDGDLRVWDLINFTRSRR